MDRVISRRKVLSTAALGCASIGLGVAAAAPKARAFTMEELPQPVAAQYLAARAACSRGADAFHAQIIADLQAQLSGQHVPADQQQQMISGMTCPLCGCPLG